MILVAQQEKLITEAELKHIQELYAQYLETVGDYISSDEENKQAQKANLCTLREDLRHILSSKTPLWEQVTA